VPRHPNAQQRRAERKSDQPPDEGEFAPLQVRFVYQYGTRGEVKGEWASVQFALSYDLSPRPNPKYRVIRIEFRDVREL
jgi:hypothetical protein